MLQIMTISMMISVKCDPIDHNILSYKQLQWLSGTALKLLVKTSGMPYFVWVLVSTFAGALFSIVHVLPWILQPPPLASPTDAVQCNHNDNNQWWQ